MIIPGFSRYDISEIGEITDLKQKKLIRNRHALINNKDMYSVVRIRDDDGMWCTVNVIRLLALAYCGEPARRSIACAKDGDFTNTVASNVMWQTRAERTRRTWEEGMHYGKKQKSRCCSAESIEMVRAALEAYDDPVSMTQLSYDLQVPYGVVRYSMDALRKSGAVIKVEGGFEVVRCTS